MSVSSNSYVTYLIRKGYLMDLKTVFVGQTHSLEKPLVKWDIFNDYQYTSDVDELELKSRTGGVFNILIYHFFLVAHEWQMV